MSIELSKPDREQAIASIERYFAENMDEAIGNLGAQQLLDFMLQEIGPLAYNKAVADVQKRLQERIAEIDIEVQEDAFQHWLKRDRSKKSK